MKLTEVSELRMRVGYARGYEQSRSTVTGEGGSTVPTGEEDGNASPDAVVSESDGDSESVVGDIMLTTHLRRDLTHSLSFSRNIRGGFTSAFETYDSLTYTLTWSGRATTAQLFSQYSDVAPSGGETQYSDWGTTLSVSYPLASYMGLNFQTSYYVRDNTEDLREDADIQDSNDYETWATRIGTSFAVTKTIDFTTYAQHIERLSDAGSLEYERDIIEAIFRYSHQF